MTTVSDSYSIEVRVWGPDGNVFAKSEGGRMDPDDVVKVDQVTIARFVAGFMELLPGSIAAAVHAHAMIANAGRGYRMRVARDGGGGGS